jgi:hypothetical protein
LVKVPTSLSLVPASRLPPVDEIRKIPTSHSLCSIGFDDA